MTLIHQRSHFDGFVALILLLSFMTPVDSLPDSVNKLTRLELVSQAFGGQVVQFVVAEVVEQLEPQQVTLVLSLLPYSGGKEHLGELLLAE